MTKKFTTTTIEITRTDFSQEADIAAQIKKDEKSIHTRVGKKNEEKYRQHLYRWARAEFRKKDKGLDMDLMREAPFGCREWVWTEKDDDGKPMSEVRYHGIYRQYYFAHPNIRRRPRDATFKTVSDTTGTMEWIGETKYRGDGKIDSEDVEQLQFHHDLSKAYAHIGGIVFGLFMYNNRFQGVIVSKESDLIQTLVSVGIKLPSKYKDEAEYAIPDVPPEGISDEEQPIEWIEEPRTPPRPKLPISHYRPQRDESLDSYGFQYRRNERGEIIFHIDADGKKWTMSNPECSPYRPSKRHRPKKDPNVLKWEKIMMRCQ